MYFNDFFKNKNTVLHFCGIGGISMSSIAHLCKIWGISVQGSDRAKSFLTEELENLGVKIFYSQEAQNVIGASHIVKTAAISDDNPELVYARAHNIPIFDRAEFLGMIMQNYNLNVGVAGTHGKSSTTSMISRILLGGEFKPTVMCGAVMQDTKSAYVLGNNDYFVFEACEYKDSFLQFIPDIALVLNAEFDHPDYFADENAIHLSFGKFLSIPHTNQRDAKKASILNIDDIGCQKIAQGFNYPYITFGIKSNADYTAKNLRMENKKQVFDVYFKNEFLTEIQLSVFGEFNVYNALAAFCACHCAGVPAEKIKVGLQSYTGTARRFEHCGKYNGADVYIDYAHHPTEISATLDMVKNLGYNRIISIFEPHTFTRTKALFNDFVRAFEKSDITIYSKIYVAREKDIYGVSSRDLAKSTKNSLYFDEKTDLVNYVKSIAKNGDIVLILGAGTINEIAKNIAQ